MLNVYLISGSNTNIDTIARIARICTNPIDTAWKDLGKTKAKDKATIRNLYKNGHWSVFEHTTLTYHVQCSRACALQLARHRHISRTEMSQRYTKQDRTTPLDKAFVYPPEIEKDPDKTVTYNNTLLTALSQYHSLLDKGIKPEDARYLLPEATYTRMILTLNLRTLLELTQKRASNPAAQWEIRQVVRDMWRHLSPDLKDIFSPELKWLANEPANTPH